MIAQEPKEHAGESNHWYHKDGRPCHQVPYKDKKRKGELKNTTLRDAREMGLVPSVSGILKVMAQPGLTNWIKEQVAEACYWNAFPGTGDSKEDWIKKSLELAEEEMSKARDLGSAVHAEINQWLASESSNVVSEPFREHIRATRNALEELGVWGQPFESEGTFASPLGYGGTIDFKSGLLIADFKCVDSLEKKLDYPDRCAQLIAYNRGSDSLFSDNTDSFWVNSRLPKFRLVNIFISTSEPGRYLVREWTTEEKEQGWRLFCACFTLWKVASRYDPTV